MTQPQYLATEHVEKILEPWGALAQHDTQEAFRRMFPAPFDLPPEKRLMLAMMEDALSLLEVGFNAAAGTKRRLFLEVAEWAMDREDTGWVFSFENCCDVLGLNSAAVRVRWIEQFGIDGSIGNGATARPRHLGRPKKLKVPDSMECGFTHEYVNTVHCRECRLRFSRTQDRIPPEKWRGRFSMKETT